MKFKKFIHDHANQIAMVATSLTTLVTKDLTDTALAGVISASVAFLLKALLPIK